MKRSLRKWDFCWGCGAITGFRCARCKKPVCVVMNSPVPAAGCAVLRKSPKAVGHYLLVCSPRCRLRRTPKVLAVVSRGGAGPGGIDARELARAALEALAEGGSR